MVMTNFKLNISKIKLKMNTIFNNNNLIDAANVLNHPI